MERFVLITLLGVVFSSYPVWAEMYRYKDANGAVRFTDNLADVPEKQRTGMAVYENEPSLAAPTVIEQPSNAMSGQNLMTPEKTQNSDSALNSQQSEELSTDPSRIDQLLKIKNALDEENAQLIKESLTLSEEKKTISGSAAIKAYNAKVNSLNARVDDYEMRRIAFQKEADAFDTALKKRLAPPPQSPQPTSP